LLSHGRWFSPGTLASSTSKTGRHDIAEILLKVALCTNNQIKSNQLPAHGEKMFHSDIILSPRPLQGKQRGKLTKKLLDIS